MSDALQPQNQVRTNTEQTCEQGSLNEQIYEQSDGVTDAHSPADSHHKLLESPQDKDILPHT